MDVDADDDALQMQKHASADDFAAAVALARAGWDVYAGVRKEADGKELAAEDEYTRESLLEKEFGFFSSSADIDSLRRAR